MDPVAMRTHRLDRAHGDFNTDIFRFFTGSPQLIDHVLWDRHAGDICIHELGHPRVSQ
jgi:hypothetical protein